VLDEERIGGINGRNHHGCILLTEFPIQGKEKTGKLEIN
jgi:hypothetical protein